MGPFIISSCSDDSGFVQLRKLLQPMPIMAHFVDENGNIEYINQYWLETMEYTEDEVVGRPCTDFLTDESKSKANTVFKDLTDVGHHNNVDYNFVTKSGIVLDVVLSATAILDKKGKILRCLAMSANNTEIKKTARENRVLSERLNLALDASQIGIWEWKIAEDELIWDDKMYAVYGCRKEDFSHAYEAWEKVVHPDDIEKTSHEVQQAILGKASFDTEFRVIDSSDKTRHIRARAIVTRDIRNEPIRMVGANWDVTKEKQLLEDLKAEQVKMLHAARLASVGEMAAGIAHEINNPLMVIKTKVEYFKYLLESGSMDTKQLMEIAKKVDSTVNRIAAIITGLKNFSRQGFSTKIEEHSVTSIVNESLDFFMTKMTDEGIQIDLSEVDPCLVLKTQPLLLSQVIINLFQNARDAIYNSPDPWIRLSAQKLGSDIEIRVTDCGCGIPEDQQNKIFNPFYTTKAVGKGTGLGLSLSKSLIEGLNGELLLDTNSSNTSFLMRFPS